MCEWAQPGGGGSRQTNSYLRPTRPQRYIKGDYYNKPRQRTTGGVNDGDRQEEANSQRQKTMRCC